MANKRMIRKDVIDTDAFLDMPLSTQALYFHLNLRADDDGFIGNPKRVAALIGASEDDLKLLIAKRFVILFENGVIVIKHWRMHNTLSANRYHETNFIDEKAMLRLKDNKSYTLGEGKIIDDSRLIESAERQAQNDRRTKDEQKTNPDKDIDIDLDIDSVNKYNAHFEEFWKAYAKKRDKKRAYANYMARLKDGFSEEELLTACKNYMAECKKQNREEKYIKDAKTFLSINLSFEEYIPKRDSDNDELQDGYYIFPIDEYYEENPPYFGFPEKWFEDGQLIKDRMKPIRQLGNLEKFGTRNNFDYSVDQLIKKYEERREWHNERQNNGI